MTDLESFLMTLPGPAEIDNIVHKLVSNIHSLVLFYTPLQYRQ